jgi:hypothetical protein
MATERQIAANRANAQKSTGPKTSAGKLKSSRNAYRHGLSGPLRLDPATLDKARVIARALAGEESDQKRSSSAMEFAQAQLELQRVRSTRAGLMTEIDIDQGNTNQLQRVVALDRYERYAHTKRRRASAKFQNIN